MLGVDLIAAEWARMTTVRQNGQKSRFRPLIEFREKIRGPGGQTPRSSESILLNYPRAEFLAASPRL